MRRLWTFANGLTALRLAAAPILVAAVLAPAPRLALGLLALAVATDLLDGRVARRRGETSSLGGLLDHTADAAFAALGLGALALRGVVPILLPVLVATSFVQYAVDSRALSGRPLRASGLGRANGIAYYVLLGAVLVRDALGLALPSPALVEGAGWMLVASSLASMADRALARRSPRRAPTRRGGPRRGREDAE